ncbi:hypothetical protein [Bradyrhizobium elkanii]|nr:hypothetical protein [Bradyrhizobium elkanii]WLA87358.1 hypothetical protein QNJ99_24330 [Bradyrhizobium elkanii]
MIDGMRRDELSQLAAFFPVAREINNDRDIPAAADQMPRED